MRILCVGAGPRLDYLSAALTESVHSVVTLESVADAAYLVALERIDTVIALTHGDAVHVAQSLVARPEHTSLVIVDNPASHDTRVAALYAGADACFAAQFEYAELEARLQALWRDTRPPEAAAHVKGQTPLAGVALSRATRCLVDGKGASLALSRREYLLMERLLRDAGTVVLRDELINYIYGDADADGVSLQRLITALRRRLTEEGWRLKLEAIPRVGYRVVSEE